ncbi:MAG TPA: hypothetical protein GX504_11160 [Clostridia bacterium]|nr:hypothetical protein [Clostridia bacterium]
MRVIVLAKIVLRTSVSLALLALMVICGHYLWGLGPSKVPVEPAPSLPKPVQTARVPADVVIKISLVGDVLIGTEFRFPYEHYLEDVLQRVDGDYGYFFANVAPIFAADDLTVANLENPLTTATRREEKFDYGRNFWFKGRPEYAQILAAGHVDVVNLANNHAYDYGVEGYLDTKAALDRHGIGYFGYEDVYETEIKGVRIGMAGFNEFGAFEQGVDLEELKTEIRNKVQWLKGRNDLVLVYFHWGREYSYEPTERQRALAYAAVDAGADLVAGSHPHVIQGVERYRDRYIVYSLGNFCYAGHKNPEDKDTFIYQQEIVFSGVDRSLKEFREPYYLPCYISSTRERNNFQPTPAKGKDIVRILQKINELSDYKLAEETIREQGKARLVKLQEYIPNLVIDLRYASSHNIVGKPLYEPEYEALLRLETAQKLKRASDLFNEQGLRLKLWDGYRPASVQLQLWENAEDKTYFAHPAKGSKHTRGCAVDVTLTDWEGNELDMPSDFDDMTEKATRSYRQATPAQKQNAQLLERVMQEAGFRSIQLEWWHFEDTDWELFDLIEDGDYVIVTEPY